MSQNSDILAYMRHKSITPLEALHKFGSLRLGARIYQLKQKGHLIHTELVGISGKRRVARYTLLREAGR